jgi:hypothetical protein
MSGKHIWYEGFWEIECKDKDGNVKWTEKNFNALADGGEKNVAELYFRGENAPTQFYLRLCNDSLVETDTLASIQNEPVGHGYAPQVLERNPIGFPVLEMNEEGDWRVVSKQVTFTAVGASIGAFNTMYIATTPDNSGVLVAYVALSLSRTILAGDSMIARFRATFK